MESSVSLGSNEYFSDWADSIAASAKRARWVTYFWKFLSFLPVPIGMISWAIGSYNLATDSNNSFDKDAASSGSISNAPVSGNSSSDITLLIVGGISVFLERAKPRKYLVSAKHRLKVYVETERYLRLQLTLPEDERESAVSLHSIVISKLSQVDDNVLLRTL